MLPMFGAVSASAAQPKPDGAVFSAMRDELARTQKQLHMPGQARPLFSAFKWEEEQTETFGASLGELLRAPKGPVTPRHTALAYVLVGNGKENSAGFASSRGFAANTPASVSGAADGYDAARYALWLAADRAYKKELDLFAEKEAYKRHKRPRTSAPEFASARPAQYYEDAPCPPADRARYERLAKRLSAVGKEYKHTEKSAVFVSLNCRITRYAQSEGGEYQTGISWVEVSFSAQTHNKDGVKAQPSASYSFEPDALPSDEELAASAHRFFKSVQDGYDAQKAEPYLGPVLFTRGAAAELLDVLFVQNARYAKPLLSERGPDYQAGQFKDKKGLRVISHLFDVYDKPLLREYQGRRLWGFAPVDDEGVAAQDLQLVKSGKLLTLPASRNVPEGEKHGNGHARMSEYLRPRAGLTNTFFVPKEPLSQEALEARLLARCRELELEYCLTADDVNGPGGVQLSFQKIYTKDGRKEPVYGVTFNNLTARTLRDISAAGGDMRCLISGTKTAYRTPWWLLPYWWKKWNWSPARCSRNARPW